MAENVSENTINEDRLQEALPTPEFIENELPVEYTPSAVKEAPPVGKPENTVTIGNKTIEIKPTLFRYFRDNTASFYMLIEMYPLPIILNAEPGQFDPERSGDKCVMDWLIAVTDDPKLIIENYNKLDAKVVDTLLTIFRRVNDIDKREEKRKNLLEAGKEMKH